MSFSLRRKAESAYLLYNIRAVLSAWRAEKSIEMENEMMTWAEVFKERLESIRQELNDTFSYDASESESIFP